MTLAGAYRARGELQRALALYGEALSLRPTQRDALLGRTIVLTRLGRADDAIASATRMLDLGTWYLGDAHYWRAFNEYQRGTLDAAARDLAEARSYVETSDVLILSGMVAFDQGRKRDARGDFELVRSVNPSSCVAAWNLGHLDLGDQELEKAAQMFMAAGGCYRAAADAASCALAEIPADLSREARHRQTFDYQARIAEGVRREAQAALYAAEAWLRAGQRARATDAAQVAVHHSETKERANALLARAGFR